MTSIRPLPMPSTDKKAGYDQVDPLVMWFLGGDTAPAATATGINDDDRYGLDLQNSGVGGFSFRAQSGNGTHFGRIDNTGVAFGGTFSHTGSAVFTGGSITMANLVVTTTATLGTATISTTLQVGGAATMGTLRVTGAATMATTLVVQSSATLGDATISTTLQVGGAATVASLRVTGGATMASTLTVLGPFSATGAASFGTGVTVGGALVVTGASTMTTLVVTTSANMAVATAGTLVVTGVATIVSTLTLSAGMNASGAVRLNTTLDVTGVALFVTGATMAGQFTSSVPNGTAPITVTSTTVCPNLNAALLAGLQVADLVVEGNYTGNGSAARTITTGFAPSIVIITTPQGAGGTTPQMGVLLSQSTSTTIVTSRATATSAVIGTAELTRLASDGFIVDEITGVFFGNSSGSTYRYAAWR